MVWFCKKIFTFKTIYIDRGKSEMTATVDLLLDSSEMGKKCKEEIDKANIRS